MTTRPGFGTGLLFSLAHFLVYHDEPPRLARQRIEANTLKDLEKGETDEDEDEEDEGNLILGLPATVWLGVVGGLLGVSFLLNLFLLLRH